MPDAEVRQVDFSQASDVEAVTAMVDAYSRDTMGSDAPLPDDVRHQLGPAYAAHRAALAWLAWVDDEPVGVATALWAFSTFAAKPRINIHDLSVLPTYRGAGLGWRLLTAVEEYARSHDCCALTLEVRADNDAARHLYRKFGFTGANHWTPPDALAFWKKTLD